MEFKNFDKAVKEYCSFNNEAVREVLTSLTEDEVIDTYHHGCVSGSASAFIYYYQTKDFFESYYEEVLQNLDELKDHYRRGGLGYVKIKRFLNNVLNRELAPIRERRHYWEERLDEVYNILKNGTEDANRACNETVEEVKKAMGINYFNDDTFYNEQVKKDVKED